MNRILSDKLLLATQIRSLRWKSPGNVEGAKAAALGRNIGYALSFIYLYVCVLYFVYILLPIINKHGRLMQ